MIKKLLLLIGVLTSSLSSNAQLHSSQVPTYSANISVPFASVLDSRVKFFAFNPDVVYTLPITVGMHTHIKLGDDEVLIDKPKLGETVQWRVAGNEKHLFIKALQPNVMTSLTLVSDKRVYQFELVSTTDSSKRVQMAYFTYPDDDERVEISMIKRKNSIEAELKTEFNRLENIKVGQATDPSKLNFAYSISTDKAAFKPSAVYDDGRFTYFRLPQGTQDLPAIFMLEDGSRNKLIPINYVVKGDQILIERLASTFVMKLGKDEIRVTKAK
jgi:type IV secretion system protein TrbG